MVWWTAQNVIISAALAALVWLICRAFRLGPVARHALWLLVLAKLLTPPLVVWPWAIRDPLATLSTTSDTTNSQQVTPGNHSVVAPLLVWSDEPADSDSEFSTSSSPTPKESAAPDSQATSSVLHSASSHTAWMKWLLVLAGTIWITGAVVVGVVQLTRIGRMWLGVNRAGVADPTVCRRVRELAARLGMQPIEVREVAGVGSPVVWSLLRPRLLWPVELSVTELSPQSLSGLIVHELAHVWRRDHWVGWAELLAGCVWWWNPLFWYVRHQLAENAELACDAWVVQTLPSGRRAYAEGLLAVCESMSRRVVPTPAVGIGTGGRRFLERRLAMILREHTPLRLPRIGLLTVAMLAATALPAWSQKSGEPDVDQGTALRGRLVDEALGRVNTAAQDYDPKAEIRDVDPGLATLREDVIGRLRTLQQMYARAGMTQEAADVAQCVRTLSTRSGSARVQPDPGTLMKYRGQVGQSFYFDVRGATGPTIWGSGVYTDDSPLAAVAVHAGVLPDGMRGIVKVTILPGQSSYSGSTRNGVQSESWNAWDGSYRVESANVAIDRSRLDQGVAPGDLVTFHDPGTLTSFRDKVGQSFTFDVIGSAEGTIWGSGQYTDDSPLVVAAVHAGVLRPGERGRIRVTILPGREQYEGSTHNGVTSLAYGSFDGSYRIDGLRRRLTREGTVTPTLEHLRDQVGRTFTINVTGSTEGQVWGDGLYTDDSSLPAAAVHAGVLRPGERGRIAVTIVPGQPHYEGTTRHGVTSQPWEAWGGSYRLNRVTE